MGKLRLNEARQLTPAPEGIGAWAEKLRSAAFNAVSEEDVQDIMEGIKKRAKEGDLNAAKMLLGYLTSSAPKVENRVIVVQTNKVPEVARPALGYDPEEEEDQATGPSKKLTGQELASHRERVVKLLEVLGIMKTATIASQLEIPSDQIDHVLNWPWFEKTGKGYRLTEAGKGVPKELEAEQSDDA